MTWDFRPLELELMTENRSTLPHAPVWRANSTEKVHNFLELWKLISIARRSLKWRNLWPALGAYFVRPREEPWESLTGVTANYVNQHYFVAVASKGQKAGCRCPRQIQFDGRLDRASHYRSQKRLWLLYFCCVKNLFVLWSRLSLRQSKWTLEKNKGFGG